MKEIIKKVILFSLPLFIGVSTLPLWDSLILKYSFPENITTIIVGDSHPQTAIDDSLFPRSYNISQSSEPYFFTYHKLRKILSTHSIDTVIVGFSPHNLPEFEDQKTLGTDHLKRYQVLYPRYINCLSFEAFQFLAKNSSASFSTVFSDYLKKSIEGILGFENAYIGSFRESSNSNLSDELVDATIKTHFYDPNGHVYKKSRLQLYYLNKIINLCEEKKAVLILINLPVNHRYKLKIPEEILISYYRVVDSISRKNVWFADYMNVQYPDSHYGDGDHLNSQGARLLTKMLDEQIHMGQLSPLKGNELVLKSRL